MTATRDDPADAWIRRLARDLAEIERSHMPFGRFGPERFPPRGVPIYDLPFEYLAWFAKTGFPKGRLGELLQVVYAIKRDGADRAFAPLRARRGGRTRLVR
jgi:uncharacterized protein (DUF3820 family)